jgi:hypothetical protein
MERKHARRLTVALLLMAAALAACTEPGSYPGSGEPCGEDDPVRGIRAGECLPAG